MQLWVVIGNIGEREEAIQAMIQVRYLPSGRHNGDTAMIHATTMTVHNSSAVSMLSARTLGSQVVMIKSLVKRD
jgi:hypothetical protein